jgi:hypothetical protein
MLPSRSVREGPFFFGHLKNEFAVVVQPMSEQLLQNLAVSHPNLFNAHVVRLMTVPPPAKPQA